MRINKALTVKKALAGAALAIGLTGVTAGAAGAVTSSPPPVAKTDIAASAITQERIGQWLRAERRELRAAVVRISASTIGISGPTLLSALRSGQSIAQVAATHGVSSQQVVQALVTAGDARIARAVANGRLTQVRGAKLSSVLPRLATRVVNRTF